MRVAEQKTARKEHTSAALNATGLGVIYHTAEAPVNAVENLNLSVELGEFISIIGPSGCGKSTLLHCLGGLIRPTEGRVTSKGSPVTQPDPQRAAFVFQDYSLLPWKTVVDNAAIGLRFKRVRKSGRRKRAADLLGLLNLTEFANHYPAELSGGMQQRVAVARALAMDPASLLLDEPFGALDEQSRRELGFEISRLLTQEQKTVVMVTHSLDEAIFWADRIVVMSARPGQVAEEIQVEEPRPRPLSFIAQSGFANLRTRLFGALSAASGSQRQTEEDRGEGDVGS